MAETDVIATKELIGKTKGLISAVVEQVRDLSQTISPSLLREVELKPLLEALLSQFHNQSALNVKLIYKGDESVSSSIALAIYRIIEAQLQNVQAYASATTVTVNINVFSSIYLSIKDDGKGFNQKAIQRGGRLTSIVHHAETLNGKVDILSSPKGDCELIITLQRG